MKALIAGVSCNRPGFPREALKFLKVQAGNTVAGRDIHFSQDGAGTFHSKITCATQSDIDNCVAFFRRRFPDEKVHLRDENTGIFDGFYRTENLAFLKRWLLFTCFLGDKVALSQVYLRTLEIFRHPAVRSAREPLFQPTETTPRRPKRMPGGGTKSSVWTIAGASVCGAITVPLLRIGPPTAMRYPAVHHRMRGEPGHAAGSGCGAAGPSLGLAAISARRART